MVLPPKQYTEPSVFLPANLLREVRRQKELPEGKVPSVCLLDPDGDILDYVLRHSLGQECPYWARYHTKLYVFTYQEMNLGVIGRAVEAPFAVLLAEQLFAFSLHLPIILSGWLD
jgi:hypothetical protein